MLAKRPARTPAGLISTRTRRARSGTFIPRLESLREPAEALSRHVERRIELR
jgi:hypothetical protein